MVALPLPPAARSTPYLRVLVADDITESRDALAGLVRELGHTCITASNGAEALSLALSEHPDLVLLDLLMPDLDGFEVTRRLARQVTDRWLPILVTSGLQGDAHFIEALTQGADDCLVRPVDRFLLEAKLRHYGRVLGLQARLAMLAERQQAIHDHIADPVLTVDAAGRICEFNLAAAALLAAPDGASLAGGDLQACTGLPWPVGPFQGEVAVRDRHGRTRPMALASRSWAQGAQSFTTLALHDLSQQQEVGRMKDEFLASVSHELRTPLTSIIGALGLLGAGAAGALPAPALQLLDVARRNSERLSRLIDDVLDLTKLEAGSLRFAMQPRPLAALLAEAVEANASYAERHGVSLHLQEALPQACALVDPDRFLQVMANLLSNAIKFSPAGGRVEVTLQGVRDGWQVTVRDHGPGVPEAFRARLFDKFAQADSSDGRRQGGTGLGLHITRMLVQRMAGTIDVVSAPGQGASFRFTLPAHAGGKPWVLVLARDHQQQVRLQQWLQSLVRLETVIDLDEARSLVERLGPPAAAVADPRGQGRADALAATLRALVPRVVLAGDSLDPGFAQQLGLAWIALAEEGSRERLLDWLRGALAASQ